MRKFWEIITTILVTLIALGTLYYFFAPPIVVLTTNRNKVNLTIDGQSKGQINYWRVLILPADIHSIRATKDGFLEYNDLLSMGKSKITKHSIFLNEMYYVSSIPVQDSLKASFLNYSADGKNLILFSDQSFYSVPLGGEDFVATDAKEQNMDVDLGMKDGESVINIKYSPDKKQALLVVLRDSDRKIKIVNFETKKVIETQSFYEADWQGSAIIGIDKIDRKKVIKWDLVSDPQEITALSVNAVAMAAGLDGKSVLVTNDDAANIMDLNTKALKETKFTGEFITKIIAIPNGQFVVLTTQKTYLVTADAQRTELNIKPYFGAVTLRDSANLLFISYNKSQKTYDFTTFNLKNKNTKVINSLQQDMGDPTDLVVNNGYANYIVSGSVMGFKIK